MTVLKVKNTGVLEWKADARRPVSWTRVTGTRGDEDGRVTLRREGAGDVTVTLRAGEALMVLGEDAP
jgi:hypothetical protein